MKRTALVLILAAVALGAWLVPASAQNARGFIAAFAPCWTGDGSSLLFQRGLVYCGPNGSGRYVASRDRLYSIAPDGRAMRLESIGDTPGCASADGRSLLLAGLELWTMQPGHPETLHLLWQPPDGHLLLDARHMRDGFRSLTLGHDSIALWTLDSKGRPVSQKPLPGGPAWAWSPSGNTILTGGWSGLWWYPVGASKPVQLANGDKGPVDVFWFIEGSEEKACYQVGEQCFQVWPADGMLKVQAVQTGGRSIAPGPKTPPLQGQYPGSVSFVLPGPSGRLLIGDGTVLYDRKPSGNITVGHFRPDGCAGWYADGRAAVFSSSGDMFRYLPQPGKTEPLGPGFDPLPAPSGNSMAFWRTTDGLPQVFVQDWAGAREMQTEKGGKNPCWLSENELAYLAWDNGSWQPAAVKRNSRNPVILASLTFYTAQLAAFPSYKEAALFADQCEFFCGSLPVFIVTAEVGGTRWYRVRAGIFESAEAAQVALAAAAPGLKTVRAWDGKYFITRAANEYGRLWPSPDGSFIVFEAMGTIYRLERASSALRELWKPAVLSPWPVRDAALSPDGSRVAFIDEMGQLNVMPSKGGPAQVIVKAHPF